MDICHKLPAVSGTKLTHKEHVQFLIPNAPGRIELWYKADR